MADSEDSSKIPTAPASGRDAPGAAEAVNPAAMSIAQLARMLSMPQEKVREHVAAGAPTGPDGTVNLVHYAAWLNRQTAGPGHVERAGTDGD